NNLVPLDERFNKKNQSNNEAGDGERRNRQVQATQTKKRIS
ncbi:6989_t:CDS:1, partial [Ambispora leptoticha]